MTGPNHIKTNNEVKIKWTIEIHDLSKQHSGESAFMDQYSIIRKSYSDDKLMDTESIVVNRKNLLQIKDKIESILNECM